MAKLVHFFGLFLLLGVLFCACSEADTTTWDDTPTPTPTPSIRGPLTIGGFFSDFKIKYGPFKEEKNTIEFGADLSDYWVQDNQTLVSAPPKLILKLSHDQKRVVWIEYQILPKNAIDTACDTFIPHDAHEIKIGEFTYQYSKWLAHLFPDAKSPDYRHDGSVDWYKAGIVEEGVDPMNSPIYGTGECLIYLGN